MNLQAMQSLVYRYGFDSTDPVTSALNSSMHEIETMYDWPFLELSRVFLQPAGSSLVSMTTDFVKPIYLKDLDHFYKVKYWGVRKFEKRVSDQTETGIPEIYTLRGAGVNTILQLWRIPNVSINYELMYQALTPDMVNPTDVPTVGGSYQWPVVTHMPIVFRTASVMLMMENEEDRAKVAQDQFERAIMSCMGRFGERELDDTEAVEDEQDYEGSRF